MSQFYMDAEDVTNFTIDWSAELDTGETISASTWTVDSGITQESESETTTTASIFVSGGTAGASYRLYNTITTTNSRRLKRFITIVVAPISA